MATNNNLSVLPFYGSLAEQNANKWWVGKVYPLFTQAKYILPFQVTRPHAHNQPIMTFQIYKADGTAVGGNIISSMRTAGLQIVEYANYDVIVFPSNSAVVLSMDNGQYYAKMSDDENDWFSEIFTVVNDMSGYTKIEWWDDENFIMDAGTIVYKSPAFKNLLWLSTDIAKPEYDFNDEVVERDGYQFPVKQISQKRYRFSFFAPEYLLDVMRFVRMADYVRITNGGKVYNVDSFLITPTWESNGDVAAVEAEFTTDTVAKKIGVGYIKQS